MSFLSDQLIDSLGNANLDDFFKELGKLLKPTGEKYLTFIAFRGRYSDIIKDFSQGIIDHDSHCRARNKLRHDLVEWLKSLDGDNYQSYFAHDIQLKTTVRKGHVLYQVPRAMQLQKPHECIVRLSFDEESLLNGLPKDQDTTIKAGISLSDRMQVELFDPQGDRAFEIKLKSKSIQLVRADKPTQWCFEVVPLMLGEHYLELRISILVLIDGLETPREEVLRETIHVMNDQIEQNPALTPVVPSALQQLVIHHFSGTIVKDIAKDDGFYYSSIARYGLPNDQFAVYEPTQSYRRMDYSFVDINTSKLSSISHEIVRIKGRPLWHSLLVNFHQDDALIAYARAHSQAEFLLILSGKVKSYVLMYPQLAKRLSRLYQDNDQLQGAVLETLSESLYPYFCQKN